MKVFFFFTNNLQHLQKLVSTIFFFCNVDIKSWQFYFLLLFRISYFLLYEDSRDIVRIFIVHDLIPDDQEIRQLIIYKASFYLENFIFYCLLEAYIDITLPTSHEILIAA